MIILFWSSLINQLSEDKDLIKELIKTNANNVKQTPEKLSRYKVSFSTLYRKIIPKGKKGKILKNKAVKNCQTEDSLKICSFSLS
jgi:hypothetical protein